MVKLNMKAFKNLEFKRGELVLKQGGLSNKPLTLYTKEIRSGEAGSLEAIYIRVRTREAWLGPTCMGRYNRGDMYMGVIKDLQDRIVDIEKRLRRSLPPLEDTALWDAHAAPEGDPMDELGDFDEPALQDNKKKEGKQKACLREPGRPNHYA